ncbi:hypothetical protein SS209_00846 [Salmonella enterica subsp. enterica serovar Senftenberg str. SS209]|nr:hypothetical protein SS209_00846 [Salmonella enterica subsp. enterica serovar Senftenberg str. SS209]
MGCRRQ